MADDMTRRDLARALKVDETTVDRWTAQGCPAVRRGKGVPSSYDLAAVVSWRIEHETARALDRAERQAEPADLDRLKARRAELDIERRELDLARARGEVVPTADIDIALDRLVIGGRQHVLATAPDRAARRIAHRPGAGAEAVATIVREEIRAALESWSRESLSDLIRSCGGRLDRSAVADCAACSRLADENEGQAHHAA
jgi:phage terminase Nu1 subunit (DNA packaging protein)